MSYEYWIENFARELSESENSIGEHKLHLHYKRYKETNDISWRMCYSMSTPNDKQTKRQN